jgi:alanine racemase
MNTKQRRSVHTVIDLKALAKNYDALSAAAPRSKVIASVKADAYGHGAVECSKVLEARGCEYFGVATLDEAAQLRDAGIKGKIVTFSALPREWAKDALDLGVLPVVTTDDDAAILDEACKQRGIEKFDIFLAVDTGMGRLGFLNKEGCFKRIARIAALPHIRIAGLFSHLAAADDPEEEDFTKGQIAAFEEFAKALREAGVNPPLKTLANSAGIMKYPQAHYDLVRPGISLYGYMPSPSLRAERSNPDPQRLTRTGLPRRCAPRNDDVVIEPVMSVKSKISLLKKSPEGANVGYGTGYKTRRETWIATMPLGYADGLPRLLSGRGAVLIRGRYAPLIGTVCMDQCMADVTDIPGITEHDEVTIMGADGYAKITADDIARQCETISYEVLTRFSQRLPKIFLT